MIKGSSIVVLLLLLLSYSVLSYSDHSQSMFSETEIEYISNRSAVSFCIDPNWLPYEGIDEHGSYVGIAADYFKLFSEHTGLDFKLRETKSWVESEEAAKSGRCDLLTFLNESKQRAQYLNFTESYLTSPVVIVASTEESYLDGLKMLRNKRVSIVKGYIYKDLITQDFPGINVYEVDSSDAALLAVSEGSVDASIGSLYIMTERIQRLGLSNLKIAGPTQYRNQFRIGVRKNDPILLSVLNKAVVAINPMDETEILSKWVKVRYELGQNYSLAIEVAVLSLLLFSVLSYRAFMLSRYNQKLNEAYALLEKRTKELDRISHTDALTGISNRLRLDETITNEVNRFKRYKDPFSVIILDIDYFKKVNDTYGHPIGDRVLIELCRLIKANLRSTDIFGRWGGEEFLILCPVTLLNEAVAIAEKLRQAIELHDFEPVDKVTVSFGVTVIRGNDGEKELVSRADEQLYRAKDSGRNRVCHD